MGDGAPCGRDSVGDHKGRPYTRTTRRRGPRRGDPCGRPSRDPRGRPSRDPRGRPSRIRHGFVGVPRPCGIPYRPERGHRETAWATARPAGAIAWATTRVAPTSEQLGDEARVGATLAVAHPATLAVAHPESGTASLPSCEVASHALAASRTDPNEAIGKPAWATARPAGAIAWATARPAGAIAWATTSVALRKTWLNCKDGICSRTLGQATCEEQCGSAIIIKLSQSTVTVPIARP